MKFIDVGSAAAESAVWTGKSYIADWRGWHGGGLLAPPGATADRP